MMSSELHQLIFFVLAFVGFLRVLRFVRLFAVGVTHGYRAYRFQQMTTIKQIAYLKNSFAKARKSAKRMLYLANFLRMKKAASRIEAKIAQIDLVELNANQTEGEIENYENKVVLMTSPDKPKVLYFPPLEKHLTTVH